MTLEETTARLRRLPPRAARYAAEFAAAGELHRIDPLLVAAVCDRESRCGETLHPKGPAGTGDFSARCVCGHWVTGNPCETAGCSECGQLVRLPELGHGRGLMQIDDRWHREWLAAHDWRDPAQNVAYGASLLRDNLLMLGGRLPASIAAYNAGADRARKILMVTAGLPDVEVHAALDAITQGHDYVSDVLRRLAQFRVAASVFA
jgi:hypothetical protein